MIGRIRHITAVAAIVAAGFAVYLNSLSGEFLWDDIHFITNNVYIRSWKYLPEIFTRDVAAGSGMKYNYYRPLTVFTYRLDASVWGLNESGFHLSNIVFHVLVAISLYFFIGRLFEDRMLSLITALLFVVHPVHTETVAYISGRPDSLVALFMLLAFILYLKQGDPSTRAPRQCRGGACSGFWYRAKPRYRPKGVNQGATGWSVGLHGIRPFSFFLMALCSVLAALSRENCVVLPPLLLLYHAAFRRKLNLILFFPFALVAAVYATLRMVFVDRAIVPNTLLQRLPGFFVSVREYARLLLVPLHLHQEYGMKLFSYFSPPAFSGLLLLASAFIIILRTYRRGAVVASEGLKKPSGARLVFFAVGWFFLGLLPVCGVYPVKTYMAEHWLYVPSVGFFLLLARGISALGETGRRSAAGFGLACLLLGYGALTVKQNNYFRDSLKFFERTVRYTPDSARLLNNLAIEYYDLGRVGEAKALFERAVELDPGYPDGFNNLGHIYYTLGKYEEAVPLFLKAIRINPRYADAYNNLGVVFCKQGKGEEGIACFRRAAALNPYDAEAHFNLGVALAAAGRRRESLAAFERAAALKPDFPAAHYHLARLYLEEKQVERARRSCERARSLGYPVEREFIDSISKNNQ